MPYRKNYRRTNRRKRSYRRRRPTRVRRPLRTNPKIHGFTRTMNVATISVDGTTGYMGAETFQLSSLPNYTEFTNLYDQYQICAVKVEYMPKFGSAVPIETGTSGQVFIGSFHTAIDFDDDTTPASANELMQYGSYRRTRQSSKHIRYLKPAWLAQTYETALTTGYSPQWNKWLSTNDPTISHYGLKIVADPISFTGSAPNVTMDYTVYIKYYIRFRSVK